MMKTTNNRIQHNESSIRSSADHDDDDDESLASSHVHPPLHDADDDDDDENDVAAAESNGGERERSVSVAAIADEWRQRRLQQPEPDENDDHAVIPNFQPQQQQAQHHHEHHDGVDNSSSSNNNNNNISSSRQIRTATSMNGGSGASITNGGNAAATHPSSANNSHHAGGNANDNEGGDSSNGEKISTTQNGPMSIIDQPPPPPPVQQQLLLQTATTAAAATTTYADVVKAGIHDSMTYLAVHSPTRSASIVDAPPAIYPPCPPHPRDVSDEYQHQQHQNGIGDDVASKMDSACDAPQHQHQQQHQPSHGNTTVTTATTTTTTSLHEPQHGSQSLEQHQHQHQQQNVDDPNNANNDLADAHEDDTNLQRPQLHTQQQQQQQQQIQQRSQRSRGHSLERIAYILGKGSLVMINFSQRNLGQADAHLIHSAILSNPQLSVLKLGYNNLGNVGANLIASAIQHGGFDSSNDDDLRNGEDADDDDSKSGKESTSMMSMMIDKKKGEDDADDIVGGGGGRHNQQCRRRQYHHHPSLSVLDLGFNNISDEGCASLATQAVSHNPTLSTLYLSGNAVSESGALALANVLADGCGLTSLHLTANRIGPSGVRGLMRSMAEFDVMVQMARQDRENMMALQDEEGKNKNLMDKRRRGRRRRVAHESNELIHSEQKKATTMMVDEEQNGLVEEDVNWESAGIDGYDDHEHKAECDTHGSRDVVDEPPYDFSRLHGFRCMEELYLGGTHMGSVGCLSVSNMLLTNLTLRVICLSDNGLNDQDLSLFSQSLSRNRELPLETLRLSFNRVTCVGVETLMNAIWGSKTLREIKLDNNQIRDRGAQLAAVVMTSVDLEVLDLGFNRLTIVGIKALMKSLAENRSLLTLTLSGNVLDTNASKAVSYALAYNKTIRKLYVDHCSLTYAAQRHIAAGIVSNSNLALRVMSGFPLGAISVTLGLPGAMETWSNEQVLKFIRLMWDRHRHEKEASLASTSSMQSMSTAGEGAETAAQDKPAAETVEPKSGPSDPATVVAAAKSAFDALGDAGGALLQTEESQRAIPDSSPMVSSDAVMLEKTSSGTLRVPFLDDIVDETSSCQSDDNNSNNVGLDLGTTHLSTDSLCVASNGKDRLEFPVDPATKQRNMEWLRLHFRSLHEMTQLPYVHADLLQLHGYFYSPAHADEEDNGGVHDGMFPPPQQGVRFSHHASGFATTKKPSEPHIMPLKQLSALQRKISYRGLHDVMMGQSHDHNQFSSPDVSSASENSSKRRPATDQSMAQPATKRARSGKPRIDYFPRLKAKIEQYLSSSNQAKALVLLRQLKFVETTMFQNGSPYHNQSSSVTSTVNPSNTANRPCISSETTTLALDAEIILLDML